MEPSITLRAADLEAILDAATTTDRAMPSWDAIHDLLIALSALVPCDLLFWTRFDVRTPRKIAEIAYPRGPISPPLDGWMAHRHEHPISSGSHGPVVSLSDVIPQAELHQNWMYQTCWKNAGLKHEIGVNLSHPPGEIHDVLISRYHGSDFDARDHLVLRLLRPHLDAALRRLAYPAPRLTPRETEVLARVRDGMSNSQISRELGIAESTVIKHLEHIFSRTGARSRTQAVHLCSAALD